MMLYTPLINVNFQQWFQSLNWRQPSWDLFIILLFLVGIFLYGFSMGRNRIIVVLLAIYLTKVIVDVVPVISQFETLNLGQFYVARIILFCVLFLILFLLFSTSGPLYVLTQHESGRWYQVIFFSILHIGLFVSIIFSYLPNAVLSNFSGIIQGLFNAPLARVIWTSLPIIALALLKDKKKPKSTPAA